MQVWWDKDTDTLIRSEWVRMLGTDQIRMVVLVREGAGEWAVENILEGVENNPFRNFCRRELADRHGLDCAKFLTPPFPK